MKKKEKGMRFEYFIRDRFRKFVDPNCERQVMSGADAWNKGDIRFSKKIPYNLMVEAKNQETYQFWKWWDQAKEQASEFDTPVLIFTKNNKDAIVALKFEDFMNMYDELYDFITSQESGESGSCNCKKNEWMLKDAQKKIKDYLKGV